MFASFRGELYKTAKRPAIWVSIGLLLALAGLLGYALSWYLFTHPPAGATRNQAPGAPAFDQFKVIRYPASFVKQTLNHWSTLGGGFALIRVVRSQGSENCCGTVRTLFTDY